MAPPKSCYVYTHLVRPAANRVAAAACLLVSAGWFSQSVGQRRAVQSCAPPLVSSSGVFSVPAPRMSRPPCRVVAVTSELETPR